MDEVADGNVLVPDDLVNNDNHTDSARQLDSAQLIHNDSH